MNLQSFFTEIKNLLTKLVTYQKTGNLVITHYYVDGHITFEKYYVPSFYNAGNMDVVIEGILIQPGETLYWQPMPFALSNTVIKFRFQNPAVVPPTKNQDLVVSYGVLHRNNP